MRLDIYLTTKNLIETRSKAQDLIKRGFVVVDGKTITKAGFDVKEDSEIKILKNDLFASRAGDKLEGALEAFQISLKDYTIVDVGASTGGFTDVSLRHGAKKVYAYDVGKDQMIESLKNNPRVECHEETNILDVEIPESDLTLIDVSFTSIIPILSHVSKYSKCILFLLKPQFESQGKGLKKGVLKDEKILKEIISNITKHIASLGFHIKGYMPSSLPGKEGNQEYLFWVERG